MKYLHWFCHQWGPYEKPVEMIERSEGRISMIYFVTQERTCRVCGKVEVREIVSEYWAT